MSQIYSKDSLDRFGDDMCQHLLSYMPIKDRFRYECVSKQWQRLIFKSQSHVCLYKRYKGSLKTPLYLNTTQVDIKCIELVLKKLSNITQIELKDMGKEVNKWLIDLIIKHCHRVIDIRLSCDGNPLKSKDLKSISALLATCSDQLGAIEMHFEYHCNPIDLLSINSNEVLFPKLRKLSMKYFGKDGNAFNKFVGIYGKQLKSIDFDINANCGHKAIQPLMTSLSQIPALIDLHFFNGCKPLNANISDCMKQIGINCRQLKSLSLTSNINGNDWQQLIQMINQYFTQLRRFNVRLHINRDLSVLSLTSKSLNGCKRLTHLTINSMIGNITTDEFMVNINQQLPRLEVIVLAILDMTITDDYLYSLAKLPKIREVYLYGHTGPQYTDEAVNHLMAKCKVNLSGQRCT